MLLSGTSKMASEKKEMVCRNCGFFTDKRPCPNCEEDSFVDKYKGAVFILDTKKSQIGEKIKAVKHGKYALKY